MPQTADEIRAAIGGRGRYPPVRSWDCVALLRLDDHTLVHLAWLATEGVRLRQSVSAMAAQLPANVSKYQLRLFLCAFWPDRWLNAPTGGGIGRPDQKLHLLNPGPAECQIAYVMRTQGLPRRQAIAFIEDPVAAERAA